MNIVPIFAFWFVLTLYFIFQGVYSLIFGGKILIASFWYFLIGWILLNIVLITFIVIRKRNRKNITNLLLQQSGKSKKSYLSKDNQYFIQTPLSLIHSQYIPIYGNKKMSYKIVFNNFFQKWITLLEIFPIFSLQLKSKDYLVDIKRVHPLSLRYKYKVYLNEKYIGKLEQHKLFTKKRMKNLISYKFTTKDGLYTIENKKFTTKTMVKDSYKNTVLSANRTFFDLLKKKQTNMREEKHKVTLSPSFTINELWLAVYLQCILDKQQKR